MPSRCCFFTEAKQVSINGEHFISTQNSPLQLGHWPGVIGIDKSGKSLVRVGIVMSFFRHSVTMKEPHSVVTHVLARMK